MTVISQICPVFALSTVDKANLLDSWTDLIMGIVLYRQTYVDRPQSSGLHHSKTDYITLTTCMSVIDGQSPELTIIRHSSDL